MLIISYAKIKLIFMCSGISQLFDIFFIILVYKYSFFKCGDLQMTHIWPGKRWREGLKKSVLGGYGAGLLEMIAICFSQYWSRRTF